MTEPEPLDAFPDPVQTQVSNPDPNLATNDAASASASAATYEIGSPMAAAYEYPSSFAGAVRSPGSSSLDVDVSALASISLEGPDHPLPAAPDKVMQPASSSSGTAAPPTAPPAEAATAHAAYQSASGALDSSAAITSQTSEISAELVAAPATEGIVRMNHDIPIKGTSHCVTLRHTVSACKRHTSWPHTSPDRPALHCTASLQW